MIFSLQVLIAINILETLWISIENNTFYGNSALQGGGICFTNVVPNPSFVSSNVFNDNNATYGNDFASYPIRMLLVQPDNTSFYNETLYRDTSNPGIPIQNSLTFELVDHFQNLVNLDFNM